MTVKIGPRTGRLKKNPKKGDRVSVSPGVLSPGCALASLGTLDRLMLRLHSRAMDLESLGWGLG